MANWKLKELRDERRRTFLKMAGVAAAAVGIERTKLLNFLADEGGYGLAEAAGKTYGRSLIVPAPNGVQAWFQELWPVADVAVQACMNTNIPQQGGGTVQTGAFGSNSSYLYTMGRGWFPGQQGAYRGTFAPGKGKAAPNGLGNNGVKIWDAGDRPFFWGPHAPWFDHNTGTPKYPVTALMSGKDETHTEFPASSVLLSGSSNLQAALGALAASSSNAIVPVLGLDPIRYGKAPGAPEVATVPSAKGMIDLFNSAASQFALASAVDRELFEIYYKAFIGLRKSSGRSSWAPQLITTKNAARIIGLNFATKLTPTAQDLIDFGVTQVETGNDNFTAKQRAGLADFGRCLAVVARAFAEGLSKSAIIALSPGPTSEQTFTDPHVTFNSGAGGGGTQEQGRNVTKYLGQMLDAFYKYLSNFQDPESPNEKLDQTTVFVGFGDTPHTPLIGAAWPDATPDNSNFMYVMDPKGHIKNGWFGHVYPIKKPGGPNGLPVHAVGYNPATGEDDVKKTSEQVTSFSCAAAVYAVAKGDNNKAAEFGPAPTTIPALINAK
jgi:hypothetical protein